MPEHQRVTQAYHVIRCEVCPATVQSRLYGEGQTYKVAREHGQARLQQGWRLFIGRTRRWYCPKHGPKAGHSMTQLQEA